ncbi:hypothetical protein RFI_26469 [Reticulomyxa filosa]|uniref:Uncharacterized protein n=1 Tax=Reticulomyxa filosa TaxID=46433 RepID=X6MA93_RETFI|nr:hypothetical protein RFI_26469 [Reticulomyxa filosa]|eukprot:ETO10908.1 hypothetical protein RFI_26469 [Reticulomyxa filosa]
MFTDFGTPFGKATTKQEAMIPLSEYELPAREIRKLIGIVHPDRFEKFLKHDSKERYLSMQMTNQRSLSGLNSLLEYHKKYTKPQTAMITRKIIRDVKLGENGPPPIHLEFYLPRSNGTFEHVWSSFHCDSAKPMISHLLKQIYNCLCSLLGEVDKKMGTSLAVDMKHKRADTRLHDSDDADRPGHYDRLEQVEMSFDDALDEYYLDEHCNPSVQFQHLCLMKHKLERNKVFWHPKLTQQQIDHAMHNLFVLSKDYCNECMFQYWMDVPIVVVFDDFEVLNCPPHVVAIPWNFQSDDFIQHIQTEIITIVRAYKQAMAIKAQKKIGTTKPSGNDVKRPHQHECDE